MKRISFTLLVILLQSCATSYRDYSLNDKTGFTESELDQNMFNVSFFGNQFTNIDKATDFAKLRASEICLSRNMNYGEISDISSSFQKHGNNMGTFLMDGENEARPATQGPNGVYSHSPKVTVTVICNSDNSDNSFDAKYLSLSLKNKYGIN